jgi:hypothetical protein
MVNGQLGKNKLILTVAILAVASIVGTLVIASYFEDHYSQIATYQQTSNLQVKGVVTSIQTDHTSQGLNGYHTFRYYITVHITEVVWVQQDLASWITSSNTTINRSNTITVGYDNPDNPQLAVGQSIECKGHYVPHTDSPFSYKNNRRPNVSGSYSKSNHKKEKGNSGFAKSAGFSGRANSNCALNALTKPPPTYLRVFFEFFFAAWSTEIVGFALIDCFPLAVFPHQHPSHKLNLSP